MSWHKICDEEPRSNQTNVDSGISELTITSDVSTVEDKHIDVENAGTEDAFAYLQGLNSDNLMQFSQQSVLQEMIMREQLELKPNLNLLPTLEEHDIGGYKFKLDLSLSTNRKSQSSWKYSPTLNKMYTRMNEICTINAVYTPKMPIQKLRIRALLCFVKEISEPVLRCQNHISKDTEVRPKKRYSILRCENPSVEYCGTAEGKSTYERYSVVIPLDNNPHPSSTNHSVHQGIALQFTCQNSCIGRKETSIIFLLEGMNGEILSQRILNVKICSCPKRDRTRDEKNYSNAKRKKDDGDELYCHPRKQVKPYDVGIKTEFNETIDTDDSDSDPDNADTTNKHFDIRQTASAEYSIVISLPNKDIALSTLDYAYSKVSSKMILEPNCRKVYARHFRNLRQLYENIQTQNNTIFNSRYSEQQDIFDGESRSNQTNIDAAITELTNTSDASTVADKNIDDENGGTEDAFACLGLNSDNLMQFSQQSTLLELMARDPLELKPNLNLLPTLEEHDIGGYKFKLDLSLCTNRTSKSSWTYSPILNKMYTRMNEICTINAVYTPKMPIQKLRVRALLCFVKEISEPVLRCQNHISKDTEVRPKKRYSILRCENPSTEYCGTAEGKSIYERYSVVIPLGNHPLSSTDHSVRQSIALQFTCQNSCIGRKKTSIIFLLEGMNGEILSQRILNVKVCSCPKRDRAMDEKIYGNAKRKNYDGDELYRQPVKARKQEKSYNIGIKKEFMGTFDTDTESDPDNADTTNKHYNIRRTPSGEFNIIMTLPSKDIALSTLDYAYSKVSSKMILEPNGHKLYGRHFRNLRQLYEKGQKM